MKLTDYLTPDLVKVPLAARDKQAAIVELVELVAALGLTADRDALLRAVLEREAQRSTGIGNGFAIPHAKTDAVSGLVIAFGRAAEPIDFAAIDRRPVNLIALLASPTRAANLHIEALARLGRLIADEPVRTRLCAAPTSVEFHAIIAGSEARP